MTEEEITAPDAKRVKDAAKSAMTQREYTFPYELRMPDGTILSGTFTNKILTNGDRSRLSSIISRLNDGQPYDSIPPVMRDFNDRLGHLLTTLTDRPKWAKDLLALTSSDVIYGLYLIVAEHEAIFRGGVQAPQGGGQESKDRGGATPPVVEDE